MHACTREKEKGHKVKSDCTFLRLPCEVPEDEQPTKHVPKKRKCAKLVILEEDAYDSDGTEEES